MEKKTTEIRPRSGELTVHNMMGVAGIMQNSFRKTLEALAAQHGNQPGTWLDELEEGLIRDAKGAVTEGIPIEADAEAIQFGVDVLQATLDAVRRNLTRQGQE